MMRWVTFVLLFSVHFLSLGTASGGEAVTGQLRGAVRDVQGKPLEGVVISIRVMGGRSEAYRGTTDIKGEYALGGMRPGRYEVAPFKEGYHAIHYGHLQLEIRPGRPCRADFWMSSVAAEKAMPVPTQAVEAPCDRIDSREPADEIAHLKERVEADPLDAAGHCALALAYERKGTPAEAKAELLEAVRLDPASSRAQRALADLLFDEGEFGEAVDAYKMASESFPMEYDLWSRLGAAYARVAKFTEAEDALRKAAALRPAGPEAHYELGMVLLGQSRNEEAKTELKKYLDISPESDKRQQVIDLLAVLGDVVKPK